MPTLKLVEIAETTPEVRDIFLDFQSKMGFPIAPNFMKVQGHSAAAAGGTWGILQQVLLKGGLPRTLKEMLIAAISKERKCRYCEAAHLACCRMLAVDSATLQQLVENVEELRPEKMRDIICFGMKCARDPQSLTQADFETLRSHGLREQEIIELIAMAGLAVYLNIVADATGVSPDEIFSQA